jgi:transposase InsO family protein
MEWKTVLAYITGTVDQELLLRNEYLVAENRILRNQIAGRVRLTDGERTTLAALGKRLGKQALAEVMSVVTPETLLAWHRRLIAKKFDGSQHRRHPGRPRCHQEIENLVVQCAKENRTWGYDRIVGALKNVGYTVSDQTVGNILKRHDLPPAPQRKKTTTWREFIRTHQDLLVGTDFFTAEVWTSCGLVTYYILFFIQVASRRVHIAGMTPHPNGPWMTQMARNSTMVEWGFLTPGQHVLHDRDTKFCSTFQETLKAAGVTPLTLPARSPNLNAHAERWVRSVKEEALSKLILFGEGALRKVLKEYATHYHQERNHQGKGNGLLMPLLSSAGHSESKSIRARERLGGLLKYYYREAA